jgi:hypothetical protein
MKAQAISIFREIYELRRIARVVARNGQFWWVRPNAPRDGAKGRCNAYLRKGYSKARNRSTVVPIGPASTSSCLGRHGRLVWSFG